MKHFPSDIVATLRHFYIKEDLEVYEEQIEESFQVLKGLYSPFEKSVIRKEIDKRFRQIKKGI